MSSLWTPGGEHTVPPSRPGEPTRPPQETRAPGRAGGSDRQEPPSEEEFARAVAEMRGQILATPVADIVAEHAAALLEIAAVHLGAVTDPGLDPARQRTHLDEARLTIDAMAALVEASGERLGRHAGPLVEALASLRLAFVQQSQALEGAGGGTP